MSSTGLPDCPEGTAKVQPALAKCGVRMTASPELHARQGVHTADVLLPCHPHLDCSRA